VNIERIVIVGLGSIGQKHLIFARSHCPKASIKVLTKYPKNDPKRNADGYFKTIAEVIEFKPQLVVIANSASLHLKTANKIAKIGAHTLVEKPLSNHFEGVEQLVEAFKKSKSTLLVGYNLRFNPSLRYFKELYKKGIVGNLFSIRSEVGQYLPDWRNGIDYQKSVSAQKSLGGGVLLELSHELDYLIWMFGRPIWITAEIDKVSDLKIDTEDHAMLIMGYQQNDTGRKLSVNLNLDFIRHDITRRCTLIGDKGSLRWDGIAGVVERFDIEKNLWIEEFSDYQSGSKSYNFEWCHFIDCALGKDVPLITAQDGLDVLSIIAAARLSSSYGERVVINYHDIGDGNG